MEDAGNDDRMPIWIAAALAAGAFAFGMWVGIKPVKTATPAAEAAVVEPAAPVDSEAWVDRRLEIVNERCGPVPFRVKMTRDSIDIDCARPENVGTQKVKKP